MHSAQWQIQRSGNLLAALGENYGLKQYIVGLKVFPSPINFFLFPHCCKHGALLQAFWGLIKTSMGLSAQETRMCVCEVGRQKRERAET